MNFTRVHSITDKNHQEMTFQMRTGSECGDVGLGVPPV